VSKAPKPTLLNIKVCLSRPITHVPDFGHAYIYHHFYSNFDLLNYNSSFTSTLCDKARCYLTRTPCLEYQTSQACSFHLGQTKNVGYDSMLLVCVSWNTNGTYTISLVLLATPMPPTLCGVQLTCSLYRFPGSQPISFSTNDMEKLETQEFVP
jgi:hypothetical protein